MCPNCAIAFDRHHDIISGLTGEEYPFVHLHAQQLVALALGADPDLVCGVVSHSQDVEPFLERIGARGKKVAVAAGAGVSGGDVAAETAGATTGGAS
jgi:hypothetical protein